MILTIDIGGTKTLFGLFSATGELTKTLRFPTPYRSSDFKTLFGASLYDFLHSHAPSIAVIGLPAVINGNIPPRPANLDWSDFDFPSFVKKLLNSNTYFMNDADLATICETENLSGLSIYLTFSTGIGGGIVKDGSLAKTSATFEPGHKLYLTPTGEFQEWESFASGRAISNHFGAPTDSIPKTPANLNFIASLLAPGLIDIISSHHPNHIVIGGPVSLIFADFVPYLTALLRKSCSKLPNFIPAKHSSQSVIRGGFLMAKRILNKSTT